MVDVQAAYFSPYCAMADFKAVISACMPPSPPEAHRPKRRDVPEEMAAGIAEVGSLVELPPCCRVLASCLYPIGMVGYSQS